MMGRFVYNDTTRAEFEDRTLAHLQAVIGAKLRRGEPFYFTWRSDSVGESSRIAIWIHPGADLIFKYYGSKTPPLSKPWIDALTYTANSANGLHIVPEPDQRAVDDALRRTP